MDSLELTIPPPAVMLVTGLAMWFLSFLFPAMTLMWLRSVSGAVILGLIGLGISTLGIISFRRANTTIDPGRSAETSALVTSGIYRFTRNPMYLGTFLVLIGWGVLLGNVAAILGAFIYILYISRYQIQPEERRLQARFGDEFISYKATVRRWL